MISRRELRSPSGFEGERLMDVNCDLKGRIKITSYISKEKV